LDVGHLSWLHVVVLLLHETDGKISQAQHAWYVEEKVPCENATTAMTSLVESGEEAFFMM
jgi:hypothetical protein